MCTGLFHVIDIGVLCNIGNKSKIEISPMKERIGGKIN